NAACFHSACQRVSYANNLDGVAALSKRISMFARPQPRQDTGDLAGADVECGNKRRTPRRQRLHLRSKAELKRAHALPPFFFGFSLSASARAAAARSDSRTFTRSANRRSTTVISRVSRFFSRASAASLSRAEAMSLSGSRT